MAVLAWNHVEKRNGVLHLFGVGQQKHILGFFFVSYMVDEKTKQKSEEDLC